MFSLWSSSKNVNFDSRIVINNQKFDALSNGALFYHLSPLPDSNLLEIPTFLFWMFFIWKSGKFWYKMIFFFESLLIFLLELSEESWNWSCHTYWLSLPLEFWEFHRMGNIRRKLIRWKRKQKKIYWLVMFTHTVTCNIGQGLPGES
jgi:hypothetical protein